MIRYVRHLLIALLCAATVVLPAYPAAAAPPGSTVVLHQGPVARQDIPARGASEPDTVVEPDVAVSTKDRNLAIAVAHDSRFSDGGAVGISVARTVDGGRVWRHRPVPGLTTANGGSYDRASDPVAAFGPDGTAYISVLLIDVTSCRSAVVVVRSRDGGQTWSRPFYAHRSSRCNYSDDKNWIVVDNSPASPHYDRVYQFWTPFRYRGNAYLGSPQAVRWSDTRGRTWSRTSYLTPLNHATQNSQPVVLPNGSLVDTYYDFGAGGTAPDAIPGLAPESPQNRLHRNATPAAPIDASGSVYASTSRNGGRTWSTGVLVTNNAGGYADGVRCCLFSGSIDAVTHRMYIAWEGGVGSTDPVYVASSRDGVQWSSPIRVSRGEVRGVQRVNVDVVARGGKVYVGYGTRIQPQRDGGFVQQQLSVSTNAGRSFGPPTSIGPRSVLKYAAQARGYFPGDYIGEAIAPGRLYMVWAVSSKPPAYSTSPYHQIIYGATLRP